MRRQTQLPAAQTNEGAAEDEELKASNKRKIYLTFKKVLKIGRSILKSISLGKYSTKLYHKGKGVYAFWPLGFVTIALIILFLQIAYIIWEEIFSFKNWTL